MKDVNCLIVTYNRLSLLIESIDAVNSQSVAINKIIIVDNNSTDGTKEYLQKYANNPRFDIILLNKNVGGAGGFNVGLKHSYLIGADWTWIMDDDTIPTPNSLEELLCTINMYNNIGFISSTVLWVDNSIHKMNFIYPQGMISGRFFNENINNGVLLISQASFVSCLVKHEAIKKVGLPISEYFIWGDDVEYTQRIHSAGYLGLNAYRSIVIHKTFTNYGASDNLNNPKAYWKNSYGRRNEVCSIRYNNDFFKASLKILKLFIQDIRYLQRRKISYSLFLINTIALVKGIFFNPKIEYVK